MKISSIACLLFLLVGSGFNPVDKSNPTENRNKINDRLQPAQSTHLDGFVGEKLDLSYQNRVLAQDADRLVAPFRNRTETNCWQSEFWGKWFTSAVLAYRYRPTAELKEKLDKAVDGLIATQTPDGYIGNYADQAHLEAWDIWGRKYCMLGLLAWYDLTGSDRALQSARREADYLIRELANRNVMLVKKGNHRGMAASSVLEPVCLLYSRTGDKRYLDFAEEIVRQWETADGPQLISKAGTDVSKRFPKPKGNWYGWEQGQKAYEMMSCYEGLLELYRLTGKEEYKQAVERTWQNIRDTEINVAGSGSAMECWFGGKEMQTLPMLHYQETCVTVTWIKLGQQLLRLTGEAKYADAIEQAFYNALLGAMLPDGSDWAKYSPLSGQRMEGSQQCDMGLNCCVASGPRGLFTFPLTAVMGMDNGVQVNFYAAGAYSLQTPGKQTVKLVQDTDYPVTGKISIRIELPKSEEMAIRLRIPEWSKQTALSVNGETLTGAASGQYTMIPRKWKTGDLIQLELDMHDRIVKTGAQPEHLAIVHGPVVLARDSRFPGVSVDAFISPVTGNDGYPDLEPVVQKQQGVWMQFKAMFVPESYAEGGGQPVALDLCDYASAGNTYSKKSRFRAWFPQLVDPGKMGK
ncbi:MAG: glycoside hydrolase family 127 protein [Porphyromonadaceae bacterium]|nr:glycoside hydrolase family 127 protein [Porphyromonadaceae bacterium]